MRAVKERRNGNRIMNIRISEHETEKSLAADKTAGRPSPPPYDAGRLKIQFFLFLLTCSRATLARGVKIKKAARVRFYCDIIRTSAF